MDNLDTKNEVIQNQIDPSHKDKSKVITTDTDSIKNSLHNIESIFKDLYRFLNNIDNLPLKENFKTNLGWLELGLVIIFYLVIISLASSLFQVTLIIPGLNYLFYFIGLYHSVKFIYKPSLNLWSRLATSKESRNNQKDIEKIYKESDSNNTTEQGSSDLNTNERDEKEVNKVNGTEGQRETMNIPIE